MPAKKANRGSSASGAARDLVVKKSGRVRGGVSSKTQLSRPYDDRVRDEFTAGGDPSR